MSAAKVQDTLIEIERNMRDLAPYRRAVLFNEFLVKGYRAITLNSVPRETFNELLRAKLCLGSLITLYDDFADRPTQSNPQLLQLLYRFNFGRHSSVKVVNSQEQQVLNFANSLFLEMEDVLNQLPHYRRFCEILNFDLAQFYNANQFSSLLSANPYISNSLENRLYGHHNMGMIMVAVMDLMATESIEFSEMGAMREVFLMGQRLGRIFNVLATRKREFLDRDITGELATCSSESEAAIAIEKLQKEIHVLRSKIAFFESRISTFSVRCYLEGLLVVQELHASMEGVI